MGSSYISKEALITYRPVFLEATAGGGTLRLLTMDYWKRYVFGLQASQERESYLIRRQDFGRDLLQCGS
jgi:hypothetical protein